MSQEDLGKVQRFKLFSFHSAEGESVNGQVFSVGNNTGGVGGSSSCEVLTSCGEERVDVMNEHSKGEIVVYVTLPCLCACFA